MNGERGVRAFPIRPIQSFSLIFSRLHECSSSYITAWNSLMVFIFCAQDAIDFMGLNTGAMRMRYKRQT